MPRQAHYLGIHTAYTTRVPTQCKADCIRPSILAPGMPEITACAAPASTMPRRPGRGAVCIRVVGNSGSLSTRRAHRIPFSRAAGEEPEDGISSIAHASGAQYEDANDGLCVPPLSLMRSFASVGPQRILRGNRALSLLLAGQA